MILAYSSSPLAVFSSLSECRESLNAARSLESLSGSKMSVSRKTFAHSMGLVHPTWLETSQTCHMDGTVSTVLEKRIRSYVKLSSGSLALGRSERATGLRKIATTTDLNAPSRLVEHVQLKIDIVNFLEIMKINVPGIYEYRSGLGRYK